MLRAHHLLIVHHGERRPRGLVLTVRLSHVPLDLQHAKFRNLRVVRDRVAPVRFARRSPHHRALRQSVPFERVRQVFLDFTKSIVIVVVVSPLVFVASSFTAVRRVSKVSRRRLRSRRRRTSKYRQYVVSTTSHADRSATSRSSAIKSSSSAICFAVAVRFSTPSTSSKSTGRRGAAIESESRARGALAGRALARAPSGRARTNRRARVAGAAASVARGRARMRRTRARGDE